MNEMLKRRSAIRPGFLILITLLLMAGCIIQEKMGFSGDTNLPQVEFAIAEINAALETAGINESVPFNVKFIIDSLNPELKPEGFILDVLNSGEFSITAPDAAGLMYGGLELAEQIKLFGAEGIRKTANNPYMELRGTKFNIPLDVRTPTYTDPSDAAQKNIPQMWSFDFWKEYIDNLARYRYNFISLWSLHPFPSMVEVPGYEDVALDDVKRSTTAWKEHYDLEGTGFDAPEIVENSETLLEMSIDEKIEFWKKVMAYGKSRNVDFYVVTWNIFTNGIDGKYGIDNEIENPVTRDYYRKSVRQMFVTYPDLAGIGLTTGENMKKSSFQEKEDWAFNTYGLGALDAAQEFPGRNITFIHRQHMAGAQDIARQFQPLLNQDNIDFIFSFKYAQAHVMSSTRQPFHEGFVKDIGDIKTIWTLRNDDNYQFRWGAPDFVREFMQNIPMEVTRGYYYGSDQWVWGRDFLMKDVAGEHPLEIVKHWYHWMLWGRLGYDPGLENSRFIAILQNRFPEADADKLFQAWQEASMIYPVTTGFHWGPLDFQWYIEACKSRPDYAQNETGFHDVNRFINLPPHPLSGYQSIPDFVQHGKITGQEEKISPLEVSQMLHDHSNLALTLVHEMDPKQNKKLSQTIHDIKTMAMLGKYYAYKISAATYLALYRKTSHKNHQEEAVNELTSALQAWKDYTSLAREQTINPFWTNRVGYVNWEQITGWVKQDIEIAKAG